MIEIKKNSPPSILLQKEAIALERNLNPNESYKLLDHSAKQEVVESLMCEQGYLCAYCMRRIPDERELPSDINDVTIEHWLPRNTPENIDKRQGLDYNNMFAVCSGNKGRKGTRKKRDLTCDAKRESHYKQLTLNPCDAQSLKKIKYKDNGEMYSDDPDVEDDIKVKLNLNCISDAVQLPASRKSVLDAFLDDLPNDDPQETFAYCKNALDLFQNEKGKKTPYVGILLWWIKNYIGEA